MESPPEQKAPRWKVAHWHWRLAIVGIIILLMPVLLLRLRSSGPSYQGKTAREWLAQLAESNYGGNPTEDPAVQALLAMGEPVVPFLTQEFTAQPPRLTQALQRQLWQIPVLGDVLFSIYYSEQYPAINACYLLQLMGPKAKAAIPDLVRVAGDRQHPQCTNSLFLLGFITNEPAKTVPVLIQCLKDDRRLYAALSLLPYGRAAVDATPALREVAQSQQVKMIEKTAAAVALVRMGESLDLALPVIQSVLLSTNRLDTHFLLRCLTRLDQNAEPLVPLLLHALQETNGFIRYAATNALKQIAPEAASRAGIN